MRRRLFFAWFCLTVTISVVTGLVATFFLWGHPAADFLGHKAAEISSHFIENARVDYPSSGPEAFVREAERYREANAPRKREGRPRPGTPDAGRRHFDEGKDRTGRRLLGPPEILVLNERFRTVTGSWKPDDTETDLARKALKEHSPMHEKTGGTLQPVFVFAHPFLMEDGRAFVCLVRFPPPPRRSVRSFLERRIFLILLSGIVAAALVFVIQRRHSRPYSSLRKAIGDLASGELSARIELPGTCQDQGGIAVELGSEFNRMADRIEELLTSRSRLYSEISHELASPLTRLNIALEMLRQQGGPDCERLLDRISQDTERLRRLHEQMLSLAHLENAPQEYTAEPVDLRLLLEEVVTDAEFEALRLCGTARHIDRGFESAPVISGNRELLRSAVENIVRNALRHTPENTSVTVSARTGRDDVRIEIRDNGPGVPPEKLSSLFEPFFRMESSASREGTGLGLAITQRIASLHGGSVYAKNAENGGLVISLTLPA